MSNKNFQQENHELITDFFQKYVDTERASIFYFKLDPLDVENYLSTSTANYYETSVFQTINEKINHFLKIPQDTIDSYKNMNVDSFRKLMFDDDVYVTYQMMKFMELADDVKKRGVLMPLQFHIKSDGFGVHPGSDKQSSIMLAAPEIPEPIPCFYIWYKEHVPEFNLGNVKDLEIIFEVERFKQIFPHWSDSSFKIITSDIEINSDYQIVNEIEGHNMPFARNMAYYLKKNNTNTGFKETYLSYTDQVHRNDMIFKNDTKMRTNLNKVKRIGNDTFYLGEYKFVNIGNNECYWIPEIYHRLPTSLVDVEYKENITTRKISRKGLNRENFYRI